MSTDNKLGHLNEEEIENLINRYYDGEKVAELINEYNIIYKASNLYTLFPPKVMNDTKCPYCDNSMYRDYGPRNNRHNEVTYCISCGHKYNVECSCEYCKNKKRNIINNEYKNNNSKVDINNISFKNRVYLAAFLRGTESKDIENEKIVLPLVKFCRKIAPTQDMEIMIVKTLSREKIIIVDSQSDLDAFSGSLLDGDYGNRFYVHKVNYILNVDYNSELINPNINIDNIDIEDIAQLWREIALDECIEYLYYQMNRVKFSFSHGDKTIEVFNDLLDKFSVSQVFNIIYTSITHATRYYQEENISKKQAANSVITRCQAYGERILANGWGIKCFSRPYDCQQSIISELFFNRIYPIGDDGFNQIAR